MKPAFQSSSEPFHNRAERVSAIKKAIQAGSYEIDSLKVANILIIHLLNHPARFQRSPFKGKCN